MASKKQISFYKELCEEIGQCPDDEFEDMDICEASMAINELMDIKLELLFNGRKI